MKKITNRCGKKTSGCAVEYELPYGICKTRVKDETPSQNQAGSSQPQTSK